MVVKVKWSITYSVPNLYKSHIVFACHRERVLVSKDGDTKQHTYEQRSADSIARTLVSPTRSQDAGLMHLGQKGARSSNLSSQTYLKSESSASKYHDRIIYPKVVILNQLLLSIAIRQGPACYQ